MLPGCSFDLSGCTTTIRKFEDCPTSSSSGCQNTHQLPNAWIMCAATGEEGARMLIVQNRDNPGAVRNAIMDSLDEATTELRICTAYMTMGGSNIYHECCLRYLSERAFDRINKYVITSLDFGLTEPDSIRFWKSLPNTEVRIAGAESIQNGNVSLSPRVAYHPKFYTFGLPNEKATVLVGSANLTGRGLTVNSEAIWQHRHIDNADLSSAWEAACVATVPADDLLIDAYQAARRRVPRREIERELQPVPRQDFTPAQRDMLPTFSLAVTDGHLFPEQHSAMWVQVERLQGGSRNQLELPRGAHRFFGFHFHHYDTGRVEHIGDPVLVSGRRHWDNRPLTWHGDNMMERINLPTLAQGGFDYEKTAVMFRRLPNGIYELVVAPWDSDISQAWIAASSDLGNLYRLGRRTPRLSGFLT